MSKEVIEINKNKIGEIKSNMHEKNKSSGSKKVSSNAEMNRSRVRFFVDLSKDKDKINKVFNLLEKANKKDSGEDITFKELALFAIDKLNLKDIEKLQESSLSEMEKVERSLNDYNRKNGTKLTLGEYLIKKLNIN